MALKSLLAMLLWFLVPAEGWVPLSSKALVTPKLHGPRLFVAPPLSLSSDVYWKPQKTRQKKMPIVAFNNCLRRLASATRHELSITCGMLQSNTPVHIGLGTISTIAFGLARASSLSSVEWLWLLLKSLAWFFGYGYFFDVGNQMVGIEEDKRNLGEVQCKANRPFATGALTLEEGKVRQILSGVYFLGVSWWMGGLDLTLCALLWVVSSLLYNFGGWGNHFVTKNYCIMSSGSAAMLLAARAIAGEQAQTSVIPPILASIWIGLCMDSQDLRDEAGDRLVGRRTTAVLMGVEKARKAWVAMTALATALIGTLLKSCLSWLDAIVALGLLALMIRTPSNKSVREDHNTYKGICLIGTIYFCRSAFWARLC